MSATYAHPRKPSTHTTTSPEWFGAAPLAYVATYAAARRLTHAPIDPYAIRRFQSDADKASGGAESVLAACEFMRCAPPAWRAMTTQRWLMDARQNTPRAFGVLGVAAHDGWLYAQMLVMCGLSLLCDRITPPWMQASGTRLTLANIPREGGRVLALWAGAAAEPDVRRVLADIARAADRLRVDETLAVRLTLRVTQRGVIIEGLDA